MSNRNTPASLAGPIPPFINLTEVEELATLRMSKMAYDYYAAGAETEQSVADNKLAFAKYRILPRILVDVSKVDTSLTMFGYTMSMPVLVAPMAMHGLAHPSKELGTARGAAACKLPLVVSTMATMGLQEVAASAGHPCLLFQLYVVKDRQLVAQWVRQAEAAGYKALVITVDAQRLGRREADERNKFRLPKHLRMVNLQPLAGKQARLLQQQQQQQGQAQCSHAQQASSDVINVRDSSEGSGLFQLFAKEVDDSLTWEAIPWLRTITKLSIYVKGILSPDDALLALQYNVDGIIVSNHGGRQLDYSPSALDMLPAVVAAVQGRMPVLMDGGIRRGTDVLKALALGARAVLLGRPVLYGLAVGGQQGVERVLDLLRKEFELAMALSGCRTVQDITPQLLLELPATRLMSVAVAQSSSIQRGEVINRADTSCVECECCRWDKDSGTDVVCCRARRASCHRDVQSGAGQPSSRGSSTNHRAIVFSSVLPVNRNHHTEYFPRCKF